MRARSPIKPDPDPAPRPRARPRRKPAGRFHHPDLRAALLAAALLAIERDGHAAVSLARLAAGLGVTQPAVYRHFASKRALLAEVARRGVLDFDAALARAVAAHPDDPLAAIAACGRAYVRFAHANPGWFRLYFSRVHVEELEPDPATRPAPGAGRAALLGALGALVPPGDPLVFDLFRATWAVAHGLAVFVVERVFQLVQTDAERIAAADAAIAVHVDGLRARFAPTA